MDIDQRKCKQETCTCYNCDDKGHLSHYCLKPQKQQIHLAEPNEVNIKGLIAKVVTAAMDAQDAAKKAEGPKRVLGWSTVKPHQTNRFSVLETSTVGSTEDMLTLQSPVTTELRTEQAVPELPPFLICSATLHQGTNIPLQLNTIDSNTPMSIKALIDSGAMGLFIELTMCSQRT